MGVPKMPASAEPYVWVWVDASYLRKQAQRCSRAARDCPHLATSHELEAIGIELMEKAAELDELQQTGRMDHAAGKGTTRKRKKQS
jgi:hypothetical protein